MDRVPGPEDITAQKVDVERPADSVGAVHATDRNKAGAGIEHGIVEAVPAEIPHTADQRPGRHFRITVIGNDISRTGGQDPGDLGLRLAAGQQQCMATGQLLGSASPRPELPPVINMRRGLAPIIRPARM